MVYHRYGTTMHELYESQFANMKSSKAVIWWWAEDDSAKAAGMYYDTSQLFGVTAHVDKDQPPDYL